MPPFLGCSPVFSNILTHRAKYDTISGNIYPFLMLSLSANQPIMPLIKRYPNRKLYDTEAKSYVTLEQIAQMVQEGSEIQVVDYESGEDLTNLTLTQIIMEQEKKGTGSLPRSLLTDLIRAGGSTLGQMRNSLRTPLEAATQFNPLHEARELKESVSKVIAQGKLTATQAQELLQVDERVADVLHSFNVPSQRDMQRLHDQVAALNEKLNTLLASDDKNE